jgi:hypothetical protein
MLAFQIVQSRFLAGVHVRRALIQSALKFKVLGTIEMGNQCCKIEALFRRQPGDLLPDFSEAHERKFNQNNRKLQGRDKVDGATFEQTAGFARFLGKANCGLAWLC